MLRIDFAPSHRVPALERLRRPRMPLELLEHALRIKPRVHVVEARDEAERDNIIFRSVNPRPAILLRGQRPTHGVDHFPLGNWSGNFPEFFHAHAIGLRIGIPGRNQDSG